MTLTCTSTFKVTRQNPELVPPAKATPCEFKPLSDIDIQAGLRLQFPIIHLYQRNPSMEGKYPVKVIRDAIAKVLVFYYPFAGRLRERDNGKLVVECTGEGILFVEADADITLQQFGDALYPPFPNQEELLYDVPGSSGITNFSLLLIQVTRLKCGGFIFALRFNHTMSDGTGIVQFIHAIGELACGAEDLSIQPVWERHLLNARQPPQVSCTHHEYDVVPDTEGTLTSLGNTVQRSFFFNSSDISAIRHGLPPDLRRCSSFELLAACIWRCRTIAISPNPNEVVRFLCIVDTRKRFNSPLPKGYYGNAIVSPAAITTVKKLLKKPLHYALKLVQETKSEATEEYVKSVSDLMVTRGRPLFTVVRSFMVSDVTHVGLTEVDFGWGKAAYAGPAKAGVDGLCVTSFFTSAKNGIVVLMCLPPVAMEVFTREIKMMVTVAGQNGCNFNASAL